MPRGRPSGYYEDLNRQVYRLSLLGHTDQEIADVFGISPQTLYNWYDAHPEFLESRARGREEADSLVAERLFQRALGYQHEATKVFLNRDGQPVYAPYIEHYPPDTQAATWWLKNRHPKKWKDKTEASVEISGSLDVQQLKTRSKEELLAELAKLEAEMGRGSGPTIEGRLIDDQSE